MEDLCREKYMTDAPPWVEQVLCREIYGILQHIATRPLSKGHDGPIQQARDRLRQARHQLSGLHRKILSESHFALLSVLIEQVEHVPPEVIARTLIGPLGNLLGQSRSGIHEYPWCFVAEPADLGIQRLAITVGPTIGLGDEILAARALIERARALANVTLHVCSHHPDLWSCQEDSIGRLPPPPAGGFSFVSSLPPAERVQTAFLFIDFLPTDPSPHPYTGPPGIAYGGRWSMGARECDFLDLTNRLRYKSRYPEGLPDCRWLEARWMAGRVLPGSASRGCAIDPTEDEAPRRLNRVILQPLTAKPGLSFPPKFFHDVLARVAGAVQDFELEIIPGPTPKGQGLIRELLEAVVSVAPSAAAKTPEAASLLDVFRRLRQSDVLFGPDTFTSHLAALVGLPQVTISLPEHRSWRTIESPCLSVVADRSNDDLIDRCARAIIAFLKLPSRLADPLFRSRTREWRGSMRRLGVTVAQYLDDGRVQPTTEADELVERIHLLYEEMAPAVSRLTGTSEQAAPLERLDLSRFVHPEDGARALARWYHSVGLTETSAIAGAC